MKPGYLPQPTAEHIAELTGLVRHHGFNEYRSMLTSGEIKPGDIILVPKQVGGRAGLSRYEIEQNEVAERKRQLQGLDWYVRRAESPK